MTEHAQRLSRVLAWAGVLVLIGVILAITVPVADRDGIQDLSGTWQATVLEPSPRELEVQLPAQLASVGIDPDARVRQSRWVELPADGVRQAIWLENPQYAVRVLWDGVEVDRAGDPSVDDPSARRDTAVLVEVPAVAGRHELVLDLRGDFAEGGLTGRVRLGPRDALRALHWRAEADRLGLALMLALLGIVQLQVAARPPLRPAFLAFGLLTVTLAVWSFALADASWALLPDVETRLRLRRLCVPWFGPLGIAFLSHFVRGRLCVPSWIFLAVGGALSVAGLLVPVDGLYTLEQVQDVTVVVALVWAAGLTGLAAWRRVRGTWFLLFTSLPPLMVGVTAEILQSHGAIGSGSYLFPAFTLFVAGAATSLALRHADEAARHARLISDSADAIVCVDARGALSDANPAAERLLDGSESGRLLFDWVRADDQPLLRGHLTRGCLVGDRVELRLASGGRVVESVATPLERGTMLLVLRDVTRRRRLDEGMLQAARMETIGVLLGGIAHDFNNMLGTLLAHVGFLQATVVEPSAHVRLQRMEGTIERASVLTRRLLTVSGGTSADLAATPLGPLCRGAAELVEPTLPRGVQVVLDVPEGLPPVLASRSDLEQVLMNLLVNARDAVGERGRIHLRARAFDLDKGVSGAVIVVDDDGPGVPDAMKEEVFAPFFTTKPPDKGTGLGLAVSAQILRDHHGRIWVEDRPGGGARFIIAVRHADVVDEAPAPLPDNKRVVLAEDEDGLREAYTTVLRRAGYEVDAHASGEAALDALQTGRPPGILVTDVVMPGMSGIDLAERCGELYPRVPVLLVSGFIPERSLPRLEDGTWYRLDKPVRMARLVSTVGRAGRRAQRARRGDGAEITEVAFLFPPLSGLTAATLRLDAEASRPPPAAAEGGG